MAGEVRLNVISGYNEKGVNEAISSLKSLGSNFKNLAKQLAGTYIGFQGFQKGVDFIRNSIDASRELERNISGLKTIFGDASGEMMKFAEAGVSMGMSTAEAAKATTFIGSVMKQSGFAMSENIVLTQRLVSLGSDLAATYGYDVQEALTGMTALFRGEYDPIEKFGVAIKQSQVNSEMAALGLNKLTNAEKLHAQQLVRMKLLFAATGDVQGAFSRQGETLFVSQQKLNATWTNMQANLGGYLIAPLTQMIQLMMQITDSVGPALGKLFGAIGEYFYIAGNSAGNFGSQFAGFINQLTNIVNGVQWIVQMVVWVFQTMGSSIISGVIAFKLLHGVITGVGTVIAALTTITTAYAARKAAAAVATTTLANAERAALAPTVTLGAALAATPWGAIATVVGVLGAGLFAIGAAGPGLDNTTKSIEQLTTELQMYQFQYDTYIKNADFGGGADVATLAYLRNQIRDTRFELDMFNLSTGRANDMLDIFNLRGAAAAAVTKSAGGAGDFTKIFNDYLKKIKNARSLVPPAGPNKKAAKATAKAVTDPFKEMVERIQGELAKLKDSIVSAFDITSMGKSGGSISRNIDKFMVKLRQFAGYIAQLRAGGLNEGLLTQLAMAGPDGGLAAAKAFAGSPALVAQANAAYGELGMTANAIAGNVVNAQAAPVYNITVSGGVGSGATIGKAVVTAIQAYERQSGPSWRTK
jgi:hypothetical protein